MSVFNSFDLIIPKSEYMPHWPVVACDQFTSQPEYWQQLKAQIADSPSALNCILPEVELKNCSESRYDQIRGKMREYLEADIFRRFESVFVYVERTLLNGAVRAGLVGAIDLDTYDFHADAISPIRATERTVEERIPPRMKVRRGASIELSHVLLLCDDEEKQIIEPLAKQKDKLEKLYDQELLMGGGHISGWLVSGDDARALEAKLEEYCRRKTAQYGDVPAMLYAVGDGNHSLATAKSCYEELKAKGTDADTLARARYAMVELENIRDDVQVFEPIHRLLENVDVNSLMAYLNESCGAASGYPIRWMSGAESGVVYLDKNKGVLPVAILQSALDEYLANNPGEIDYIHGEDVLSSLSAKENAIGFALEALPKGDFFMGIAKDGVLPRKTFSMGEAQEKRYYLEARKL